MNSKITKYLNKSFDIIIFVFVLFAILPFFILSMYVNPSWDDFDYTVTALENGFFKSQFVWYVSWSGRYFSTAVLSGFNPLLLKSILGYKIITFFYLLLFLISVYYLISEIASDSISKIQKLLCTLSFSFIYFNGLPSVSLALYWMPSAVIYQLANSMTVILILLLIKFYKNKNYKVSLPLIVSICLLIFAIEGCNEVSMITSTVFFVLLFCINTFYEKKINKYLLLFAVVSVISFCLMYLAPGNGNRTAMNPEGYQLFFSLKNSAVELLNFIRYKVHNLVLLIFTIIFVSFYAKYILPKISDKKILAVNPVYSASLLLIILYSGIFVSNWSLGTSTPFRTLNVIYFIFLAGWFINIVLIVNYLFFKKNIRINILPGYALVILCACIFFIFYREPNSVKEAYKDIVNGSAVKFDSELKERYKYIYSDKSDTCKLDSLTIVPYSLIFYDIGLDPEAKYNKLQSEFFNKEFILVKE